MNDDTKGTPEAPQWRRQFGKWREYIEIEPGAYIEVYPELSSPEYDPGGPSIEWVCVVRVAAQTVAGTHRLGSRREARKAALQSLSAWLLMQGATLGRLYEEIDEEPQVLR